MHFRRVFGRPADSKRLKVAGFYPMPKLTRFGVVGNPLDRGPFPDSDFCPFQLPVGGVVGVESCEASEPPTFSNRVKIVSN